MGGGMRWAHCTKCDEQLDMLVRDDDNDVVCYSCDVDEREERLLRERDHRAALRREA